MSTPPIPPVREPARFEAASLYVLERPAENMATLTEMEFRILVDGDLEESKSRRDFYFGIAVSAVFGGIGLAATINWGEAFKQASLLPFVWTGVMSIIAISTFACGAVHWTRYRRTKNSSAYSALIERLRKGFPGISAER